MAKAAGGHLGPWLSGWLNERQDITLDEMVAITKKLNLSLAKILQLEHLSDLEWEIFGALARLDTDSSRRLARKLIVGIVEERLLDVERPTLPASEDPHPASRGRRGARR